MRDQRCDGVLDARAQSYRTARPCSWMSSPPSHLKRGSQYCITVYTGTNGDGCCRINIKVLVIASLLALPAVFVGFGSLLQEASSSHLTEAYLSDIRRPGGPVPASVGPLL